MNIKNDFETVNFRVLIKLKYFFKWQKTAPLSYAHTKHHGHVIVIYLLNIQTYRMVRRLFKTLINRRFSNTKQIQYKDDMFDV